MLTDQTRETVATEEMTTYRPLTTDELKTLRLRRGWVFKSSETISQGAMRYTFEVATNRVERRGA